MQTGLEGVIVAETILSEVDGEAGRLVVRGYPIDELTGRVSYAEMAALLWQGLAEGPVDAGTIAAGLGEARVRAFEVLAPVFAPAGRLTHLEGLRLGLSALSDRDPTPAHLLVSGAIPVILAAVSRLKEGDRPLAPDPSLDQAADFLRMRRGERAPTELESALTAYLVTVAEHGMNASTFTARVVASTQAGMVSSVVAALCALKGPLHGGAPGPVLDMLDAIGSPDRVVGWLDRELAAGRRLMGFGHRIYRVTCSRRSSRRCGQVGIRGSRLPSGWRRSPWSACAITSLTVRSTPTSSFTRLCCWKPSVSIASSSPLCSPWDGCWVGRPMSSSKSTTVDS